MDDKPRNTGQPKGPTKDAMALEQMARKKLTEILPRSVKEQTEYGAVICKHDHTGKLSATELHRATISDSSVDVGQRGENCGCPSGTTAIAYYHTHPIAQVYGGNGSMLHYDPSFSDDDTTIADDRQLVAFLGSFDGKFRRYDPPILPTTLVDGKKVINATDADGHKLPTLVGVTTILNGKLPTR
jgi:hypothetical protein